MSTSDAKPAERDFFSVAGELTLLEPRLLSELAEEASRTNTDPSQLALRKGLLDAVQVDIIETLLRPTETVPGYEIASVLGHGGMGVVYRARQLNLNRVVALKTVLVHQLRDSTALKRFEQEAQAVAQLAHPHVVAAYDFGRHEGRLYFAMELITGQDVHDLVARRGPLDERTTWGLVRQAAAGLAHAAEHGIVHRDIKPANLLLVEAPAGFPLPPGLPLVKIADFGLARLTSAAAEDRTRLTMVDSAVGSPHYMSPEQLRGEPVDQRTDIFALGTTAFHMLSGNPPLAHQSLPQIFAHRMSGEVESLAEVCPQASRGSVELVAAMMAHDPNQRIADYHDLMRRIDALEDSLATTMPMMAFSPPALRNVPPHERSLPLPSTRVMIVPRSKKLRPWTIGLLALAAALAVVAFTSRGGSAGPRELVPSGRIEELFNGQNISQWKTQSGGWNQAKNDEGALVLEGRGLIRRPIFFRDASGQAEPAEHYRLTLLVDPHDATAVEVQFDLPRDGADDRSLTIRIDSTGCVLGRRGGDSASAPTVLARRAHTANAGTLRAIQLERQSGGWFAFVDDQFLGSAPFLHADPAAEFRLLADGGSAWFSDFTLEELARSPSAIGRRAIPSLLQPDSDVCRLGSLLLHWLWQPRFAQA